MSRTLNSIRNSELLAAIAPQVRRRQSTSIPQVAKFLDLPPEAHPGIRRRIQFLAEKSKDPGAQDFLQNNNEA